MTFCKRLWNVLAPSYARPEARHDPQRPPEPVQITVNPVTVGPDDRLVVCLGEHVTAEQVEGFRDALVAAWADTPNLNRPVLVLGGCEAIVLRNPPHDPPPNPNVPQRRGKPPGPPRPGGQRPAHHPSGAAGMTTPTADEIRSQFNTIRSLFALSGLPGKQTCKLEEDLVELAERERRAPTTLTTVDGYPTAGEGGPRSSDRTSITERSAIRRITDEDEDKQPDPVGQAIVAALDFLDQCRMSAQAVHHRTVTATQMSSFKKPRAHVAEACCEQGCEELAVPGGKGRCEADRKWLSRHPDVQAVPRDVIEARKNRPRRRHENGPLVESEGAA